MLDRSAFLPIGGLSEEAWVHKLRGYGSLHDYLADRLSRSAAVYEPGTWRSQIFQEARKLNPEILRMRLERNVIDLEVIYAGRLMVARALTDDAVIRQQVREADGWQDVAGPHTAPQEASGSFDYVAPEQHGFVLCVNRKTRFFVEAGILDEPEQVKAQFLASDSRPS
jgi:hypothetical protein